jgi:glycosyltransferase involved in cell wall biosynthesis
MLPQKVREAAFVVTISEDNRRLIVAECGPDAAGKVEVIHCGVDLRRFEAPDRLDGDGDRPLRILAVGTLHEVKGQVHLVDACAALVAAGVDVECTFVGEGPDRSSLEQRVERAGLTDRVRFAGRCPQPEVVAHLHRADVLVAASVPTASGKREGIPVVLIEAMATGLPVVASRLSGIPELVADGVTGILVEPGDVGALVTALQSLLDPHRRRQLGEAGQRAVRDGFDLERGAGRLIERFAGAGAAV